MTKDVKEALANIEDLFEEDGDTQLRDSFEDAVVFDKIEELCKDLMDEFVPPAEEKSTKKATFKRERTSTEISTGEAFAALGSNTADVCKKAFSKEVWSPVGKYFTGIGKAFVGKK